MWMLLLIDDTYVLIFVGSLNCAAFMAGIIEAFLNGTQFVSTSLYLSLGRLNTVHEPPKLRESELMEQTKCVVVQSL